MFSFSKLHFFIVPLLFSTISVAKSSAENIIIPSALPTLENAKNFANNEIIVTLKKDINLTNSTNMVIKKFGKQNYKIKNYKNLGFMHLKSKNYSTKELMQYFSSDKMKQYVESVSPNNIMIPTSVNDTYFNKQWALKNTGQNINNVKGTADADIHIAEAWAKTKGEQSVIVAVLDTGIDSRHSDLQDNMWNGEANHGFDFAGDNEGNNDDDPMPDLPYSENGHYHGTHVAGILGAVSDNSNGIAGVSPHISIMSLKVFRPNGYGFTSDVLEALEYISEHIDNGDNIVAINASYGGYEGDQNDPLNKAIKKLGEQGVLFCTAAGNESTNIDETPSYPASYNAENIIVVGASDQNDQLASFSNYGKNSVDLVAPGTNILSTYPDNEYAYMQGTSMATPYVSATVALIASLYSDSTVQERKAMILKGIDIKENLKNQVKTSGRLNAIKVLTVESSENITPIEETQEIALPIVDEENNERKWQEVTLTNGSIKFTTKKNITMEFKYHEQKQLIGTISSNQKSTNLLLNMPNGSLQIDNEGNAILAFQEKGIKLEINSNGDIKSNFLNLNEAILPKEPFPLGTNLTLTQQDMKFTLPLSNNIEF